MALLGIAGTAAWASATTAGSKLTSPTAAAIGVADSAGQPWASGQVHIQKLKYGTRDSDSVRHLQWALQEQGYSSRVTGNYLDETDAAVREWQAAVGDTPDEAGRSSIGPGQAARLFADHPKVVVTD